MRKVCKGIEKKDRTMAVFQTTDKVNLKNSICQIAQKQTNIYVRTCKKGCRGEAPARKTMSF